MLVRLGAVSVAALLVMACTGAGSEEIEVTREPGSEACLELFDAALLEEVTGQPVELLSTRGQVTGEPVIGAGCAIRVGHRPTIHVSVGWEYPDPEDPSRHRFALPSEQTRTIGGWEGFTSLDDRWELPARGFAEAWAQLPWVEDRGGFTRIMVDLYQRVEDRDPEADAERLTEQLIEVVEGWSEAYLSGEHERPPSVDALGP